jgi:hypothetical protein
MLFLKRLMLAAVLGLGFAGTAFADGPKTPWSQADSPPPSHTSASANVTKIHSATAGKSSIEWKVDVEVQGAKGRDLVVELELCNAAGQPFLSTQGSTIRLRAFVTPDSESFNAEGLEFRLATDARASLRSGVNFWDLYGGGSKEITFRVIVREEESGKVISTSGVMKVSGLTANLAPAAPKPTDNPGLDNPRNRSVWGRLVYG